MMFPTTLGFNVTHETNAEKRPLARDTIITPDKRIVTVFNALIPSEAAWVFCWILKTTLPQLVDNKKTMADMYMDLNDEDKQIYLQIDAAIKGKISQTLIIVYAVGTRLIGDTLQR